jgi:hypothetical protein
VPEAVSSIRPAVTVMVPFAWSWSYRVVREESFHTEVVPKPEQWKRYRLRVGEVLSDGNRNGPPHSRVDVTEIGAASAVTVSEAALGGGLCVPEPSTDMLDAEFYGGITTTGKRLLLASWRSDDDARAWIERQPEGARHRHIRVIRDYGMHSREEAPQYFPERQGARRLRPCSLRCSLSRGA